MASGWKEVLHSTSAALDEFQLKLCNTFIHIIFIFIILGYGVAFYQWKPGVVIMLTLSSQVASQVLTMKTCVAISDYKVGIMTTLVFFSAIVCVISTHWGRVTHICVGKLTIIDSDNGLSPGRRQAIIWTNDGTMLIRTLGTNFSEILSDVHSFSFKEMHLKISSAK